MRWRGISIRHYFRRYSLFQRRKLWFLHYLILRNNFVLLWGLRILIFLFWWIDLRLQIFDGFLFLIHVLRRSLRIRFRIIRYHYLYVPLAKGYAFVLWSQLVSGIIIFLFKWSYLLLVLMCWLLFNIIRRCSPWTDFNRWYIDFSLRWSSSFAWFWGLWIIPCRIFTRCGWCFIYLFEIHCSSLVIVRTSIFKCILNILFTLWFWALWTFLIYLDLSLIYLILLLTTLIRVVIYLMLFILILCLCLGLLKLIVYGAMIYTSLWTSLWTHPLHHLVLFPFSVGILNRCFCIYIILLYCTWSSSRRWIHLAHVLWLFRYWASVVPLR